MLTGIQDDSFLRMIEDKFKDTPGAECIKFKDYYFEDKQLQPMNLQQIWSSHTLAGTTVFMRVELRPRDPSDLPLHCEQCAGCVFYWNQNVGKNGIEWWVALQVHWWNQTDTSSQCGTHYRTITSEMSCPMNKSAIKLVSVYNEHLSRREIKADPAVRSEVMSSSSPFFKRIQWRQVRSHTQADWQSYNLIFMALYLNFNLNLNSVHSVLNESYGFEPT